MLKISDFGGGLNNFQSREDIKENQSSVLTNLDITTDGQLRPLGGFDDDSGTMEAFSAVTTATTSNCINEHQNCSNQAQMKFKKWIKILENAQIDPKVIKKATKMFKLTPKCKF